MTDESIYLTDEQKKTFLAQRIKRFTEGLDALIKETGLKLVPIIKVTSQGIIPLIELVHDNPNSANSAETKTKDTHDAGPKSVPEDKK